MNILDLFTRFYGKLRIQRLPFWILTPIRRLVREIANLYLPYFLNKKYLRSSTVRENLIISLTSFPARINDVWMVVECLKRQSILPSQIILWLSREQFPSEYSLPQRLIQCQDDLFSIEFVDDNIKSHKKYYYTIKEYPDFDFVTCDDDVFYDSNMIKRLLDTFEKYPSCIIANHTSHIKISEEGFLAPYKQWDNDGGPYASSDRLQIGVGGVFYPSHSLYNLVLRKDLFINLAPMADDLWLNCMARLEHTDVVQSSEDLLLLPIVNRAPSLSNENNGNRNMNDVQIERIRIYLKENGYEDVYSIKM